MKTTPPIKILKVSDIPAFFRPARYKINVSFDSIERTLESFNERGEGVLGLDLDPDFQRCHVWTEDKQIRFVEYILRGGQSSKEIIFNHPGWQGSYKGQMVLVDGKQRLEAARKFMRNELPIFNGHYLENCEPRMLKMSDADLIFSVNNLNTRKDVLQWYLDLNSGGVVHTTEELDKVKEMLKKEK